MIKKKDGNNINNNRRKNIKEEEKMYIMKNIRTNNAGHVMNMAI